MEELSVVAGKNLDPKDFELFKSDLSLLLSGFSSKELVAEMGKNKSNFSNRINGKVPISKQFLTTFYEKLGPWITGRRAGKSPIEIKTELATLAINKTNKAEEPPRGTTLVDIMTLLKSVDASIKESKREKLHVSFRFRRRMEKLIRLSRRSALLRTGRKG